MELASIFTEPTLRRCWLLNKALEDASLEEALKLAWAADAFLGEGQANPPSRKNGRALKLKEWPLTSPLTAQPASGFPAIASACDGVDDKWIFPSFAPEAAAISAADQVVALVAESLENAGVAQHDREEEVGQECSGEEPEDEPAAGSPPAIDSELAVWAGVEEIVRYLRQQDDVVVSAGTGAYLVNGRFHLNSEELLARANKIRHRQGKPQFQPIPPGFRTPSGGAAAERVQDRA